MFDMDRSTNSAILATSRNSSKAPNSCRGARSATAKTRVTSRSVLPHFLLRSPYGKDVRPNANGEDQKQRITGRLRRTKSTSTKRSTVSRKTICWGNAAYALAERITNAFALYRWTAAIRGVEGGGLVEGLPAVNFKTDEGDVVLKCPTEVSDHRPPREGTERPRVHHVGPSKEHRSCSVLWWPDDAETESLRVIRKRRRTPVCPVNFPTLWPRRDSRTTSRR